MDPQFIQHVKRCVDTQTVGDFFDSPILNYYVARLIGHLDSIANVWEKGPDLRDVAKHIEGFLSQLVTKYTFIAAVRDEYLEPEGKNC